MEKLKLLDFVIDKEKSSIIKVIGVGGGGCNAVNHMYREGIHDVSFVVCNTDYQALEASLVQTKIQLGANITEGLGAGNKPEKARNAAIESLPEIEQVLNNNTKMVFVTTGMGGGTGTGASPIIAKAAKDAGKLTVGIATIPFVFEGNKKRTQAMEGIDELKQHVDALLIIDNEKLKKIYPDLMLSNAFAKADDVLTKAAKGISEIITVTGRINRDFADVDNILRDSGIAIMNSGTGSGEKRINAAIRDALKSPLLDNNDFRTSKKMLLVFYCSKEKEITMEECNEIDEFIMQEMNHDEIEVIWGIYFDETLGDDVKATIIATGFDSGNISDNVKRKSNKIIYDLDGNPVNQGNIIEKPVSTNRPASSGGTLFQQAAQTDTAVAEPEMSVKSINDNKDYFERLNNESAFRRSGGLQKAPTGFSNYSIGKFNLKDKNGFLNDNPD